MTYYKKSKFIGGAWVRNAEVKSGSRCKLVSETEPRPSQFKDKEGNVKMQDVAKIRFESEEETKNVALNRATINGLVDAFGEDSKIWINKPLTAITEKIMIAGRRVVAVYLLADGYEMQEDDNGYVVIVNPNKETTLASEGEIEPSDIPF